MNRLPWIVYTEPDHSYRIVTRFGTRPEAEMHAQRLNRLDASVNYKVCWDKEVKVAA
ncbi:hypothetical protein [Anabaena lutea]|uniref:SPOR domain-containing protein n=1 Tax=Anabaena lutea FACHB-196 TaxID=2692881 RepID=A0ABR8FDY0_9NOST|nr:hypothetical protein [Anabaena lutea]MBD2568351.1 hypothetical protein [Anabaena lutea FACHB-196]